MTFFSRPNAPLHVKVLRSCAAFLGGALALYYLGLPLSALYEDRYGAVPKQLREDLPKTVLRDHHLVANLAAAMRALTDDPAELVDLVERATLFRLDYADDIDLFGVSDHAASLADMLAMQRKNGWLRPRGDCDERAIFAANLLQALGLRWRIESSVLLGHAWVVVEVDGAIYGVGTQLDPPEWNEHGNRLLGHLLVQLPPPSPRSIAQRINTAPSTPAIQSLRTRLIALDRAPF